MKTNVEIGMVNPSTDELLTKVDSRYGVVARSETCASAAGGRSREVRARAFDEERHECV